MLRDGAVVTTLETSDADVNTLASEMLGRTISLTREGAAVGLSFHEEGVFEPDDRPPEEHRAARARERAADVLVMELSSGGYVRAVAEALDGHCVTLRRTRVGPFEVGEADPKRIIPPEEALSRLT